MRRTGTRTRRTARKLTAEQRAAALGQRDPSAGGGGKMGFTPLACFLRGQQWAAARLLILSLVFRQRTLP
jgi:hypothetical protein